MAVTGYSDCDRAYRRSLHRRDDSGELDVFEAARYFSGYADIISCDYNPASLSQKITRNRDVVRHQVPDGNLNVRATGRDVHAEEKASGVVPNKEKIGKHGCRQQPSSPGGRLASFLNSLFSQSAAKKKKSTASTQSLKDLDDYGGHEGGGGGWRRRRRSSISHFRSSSNVTTNTTSSATIADSRSLYCSSSSSGFRTPPPLGKSYKDLRSLSEHKEMNLNLRIAAAEPNVDRHRGGFGRRYGETGEVGISRGKGREYRQRKFGDQDDEDDGNDSDSSSDLFELQNYELGYCSSGLPVYETTRIDSIKRGPSLSNIAA